MPDKRKIGAEIKRIVDEKNVRPKDLATALGKTKTTVYNIYDGGASYELLKLTLDVLDDWHEADPLSTEEAIDLED